MTKPSEHKPKEYVGTDHVNDISASTDGKEPNDAGKKPGTTSGNEDYGSTEREPLDGHSCEDEEKPSL